MQVYNEGIFVSESLNVGAECRVHKILIKKAS
jgi:hypothetical protein